MGRIKTAQLVQQVVAGRIGLGRVHPQLQQMFQTLTAPGRHADILVLVTVLLKPVQLGHRGLHT